MVTSPIALSWEHYTNMENFFWNSSLGIRGGVCCTQGNRLEVGIQRFPNLLRWTGLACRLPYPGAPKSADDCCFLFGFSLHLPVTGSAITLVVSRLQSSLRAYFALMLRPASWLALLSRTFTFELAP